MGLFNKAAELNILTGAKVAAIVFSPHDKCFSFGTPNCKSVIDSYFHTTASASDDHHDRIMINNINDQNYNNDSIALSILENTNRLEEDRKMKMKKVDGFWWDSSIDHDNMSLNELMSYKNSLLNLKENVEKRAMDLLRISTYTT
uniref:MADS26 n=1 Tax=Hippophae rhamnoides TaxID=193516 RepID=A0AAU7LJH0_9ROSA